MVVVEIAEGEEVESARTDPVRTLDSPALHPPLPSSFKFEATRFCLPFVHLAARSFSLQPSAPCAAVSTSGLCFPLLSLSLPRSAVALLTPRSLSLAFLDCSAVAFLHAFRRLASPYEVACHCDAHAFPDKSATVISPTALPAGWRVWCSWKQQSN
ncbi:hypothetical protein PIB30_012237 [Stylosanthes scabra]|uniref:Transmembrane protein n=1 Tax=Stylosanthes scabra TaxID=79078 RepID=A0ABU6V4G8_9FABA|nr:hypothetical protein [Stylosanthes scabra]